MTDNIGMTQEKYWSEQDVFEALNESISSGVPNNDFVSYLKDFQQDKLTTSTSNRPPNFYMQCVGVMIVISRQLQNQGRHQVIKQIDIPAISPVPNFLSVIAALWYVTKEIELTSNLGYDHLEIEAGIRTVAPKVGYAEIIVSNELVGKLTTPPEQVTSYSGRVIMQGRSVVVEYINTTYVIADLQEGSAYYKFVKYLLSPDNYEIDLKIEDIKASVKSTETLSELIRHCGFTKELKEAFFPRPLGKYSLIIRLNRS